MRSIAEEVMKRILMSKEASTMLSEPSSTFRQVMANKNDFDIPMTEETNIRD